jgi:hypothetical protein
VRNTQEISTLYRCLNLFNCLNPEGRGGADRSRMGGGEDITSRLPGTPFSRMQVIQGQNSAH